MARSHIIVTTNDLISDSGSVLWSFVKGEQLEFPVVINFITDATAGYIFEAVIVEAKNVANQEYSDKPVDVEPGGDETTLTVRLPSVIGTWSAPTAYNAEDVVLYSLLYYKLLSGAGYISAVTPDLDANWELTTLNKVYIQFPSTIAATWTQSPNVDVPVYGFFELRVTEPTNPIFVQTWKPVRGLVEVLFSPTDLVP